MAEEMRCPKISILALILASALLIGCAGAATITVCETGCDETSILSALDHSTQGDVIEVRGGTYDGNLIIRKNVSLVGIADEKGMPVINGSSRGTVISILADGVSLTGFKVTNSGDCGCGDSGVRIRSNNTTVYGNNITGNHYGVDAKTNTTGNRIFSNSFVNNSLHVRDWGKNQWYGEAPSSGSPGGVIGGLLGHLGRAENDLEYLGNYYDDYDEEGEGCIVEAGEVICSSPYKIIGKANSTDPYPLASQRL